MQPEFTEDSGHRAMMVTSWFMANLPENALTNGRKDMISSVQEAAPTVVGSVKRGGGEKSVYVHTDLTNEPKR